MCLERRLRQIEHVDTVWALHKRRHDSTSRKKESYILLGHGVQKHITVSISHVLQVAPIGAGSPSHGHKYGISV
jgi:hypothetical protein